MKKLVSLIIASAVIIISAQADNTKSVEEKIKAIDAQLAEMMPNLEIAKSSGNAAFEKEINAVVENLKKEREQLIASAPKSLAKIPGANGTSASGPGASAAPAVKKEESTAAAISTKDIKTAAAEQTTAATTKPAQQSGEPLVIPRDTLEKYHNLNDEQKTLIGQYISNLAIFNIGQELPKEEALYDQSMVGVTKVRGGMGSEGDALAAAFGGLFNYIGTEKGVELNEQKHELGAYGVTPIVNKIELAIIKSPKSVIQAHVGALKDLQIPLTAEIKNILKNLEKIQVKFEARSSDENKVLQDALDVHKLSSDEAKKKGYDHTFIVLTKRPNSKWVSIEHIIGKKQYDQVMQPNVEIIIPKNPKNSDFLPVQELRIDLLKDKAIFPVREDKEYKVRLAPCKGAENNVQFTEAPTKFCVQEIDRNAI